MKKPDKKFLESLAKIPLDRHKELPDAPGVYLFTSNNRVIYVGKAVSLKRRVASYFDLKITGKTASMMRLADTLSYIRVDSELEALLLEAKLIRSLMPHYNVISKDDKHPLYIVMTKEKFPRILSVRKLFTNRYSLISSFGPFPSSSAVKNVLRMIRRVFPYSDHKIGRRKCLYAHIGLCDPCPNEVEISNDKFQMINLRKQYLRNINAIKALLSGKLAFVKKKLEKEMYQLSISQMYEEANDIKQRLQTLDYITRPQISTDAFLQNPNLYEDIREKELSDLSKIINSKLLIINSLHRIECYDIAHLSGKNPTASMVVFIDGEKENSSYRHFKIKKAKGGDDYESMREVARRRVKHLEDWGRPDLIIVDGGAGQVKAFTSILYSNEVRIPVVGIAKNPDRLMAGDEKIRLQGPALNLVVRIRDETHRFARRLHHKLLSKSLLASLK